MYCGKTPFKDKTEFLIFRKIEQHKIVFPKEVPEDARDLIIKLLDKDPNKRLGSGSSEEGLDFEHLNLFNALQSDNIKIFLPQKYNMLVSKTTINGKNDTYFNLNVYNALLKN